MGRVLQIQHKYEQALAKYQEVCGQIAADLRKDLSTPFYIIPQALSKSIEIMTERKDLDRAEALVDVEQQFLDILAVDEHERAHVIAKNIPRLLGDMDRAFSVPTATKRSPDDIVRMLEGVTNKGKSAQEEANKKRIFEALQARQRHVIDSRWERMLDAVTNSPVGLTILITVMVAVFIGAVILVLVITAPPVDELAKDAHELRSKPRPTPIPRGRRARSRILTEESRKAARRLHATFDETHDHNVHAHHAHRAEEVKEQDL